MKIATKVLVPRVDNMMKTKLLTTPKARKVPAYLEVKKTNAPAEARQVSR